MKKNKSQRSMTTSPASLNVPSVLDKDNDFQIESQKRLIFNYLFLGNSITALEAVNIFNCFSLRKIIYSLRLEGCEIIAEMIQTSKKTWIARYSLQKYPNFKNLIKSIENARMD